MVLPEAFFMLFEPPPIPGIGMAGGFNFVLEDLSGTNVEELRRYTDIMVGAGFMNPLLRNVFCSWNAATSSVYLEIDREKALQLGVNLNGLYTMLEGSLGFLYINDFNRFGQVYKTEVQSAEQARDTVEKIKRLYVANRQGEMVPLPSLVKIRSRVGLNSRTLQHASCRADSGGTGTGAQLKTGNGGHGGNRRKGTPADHAV
ncbi:MAG: efflux RND transporter permease subunit [Victivallales bacterium]